MRKGADLNNGTLVLAAALAALLAGACNRTEGGAGGAAGAPEASDSRERVERVLGRGLDHIQERADSVDAALRPVPLLTGSEEASLRRYLNAAQLARARSLGVRPSSEAEMESLQRSGRLVALPDSTRYWVVRKLEHSLPLVTPDARALLTEIGERFHERLDSLGLPPFRLEVTSVLRTADTQADLRSSNPNAARGVSTHEFGTTLDIAYSSFAAPETPLTDLQTDEAPWLEPYLQRVAASMLENIGARRSRELQTILGNVLREMQSEGKVMVTLERRQPVFHITVARRY